MSNSVRKPIRRGPKALRGWIATWNWDQLSETLAHTADDAKRICEEHFHGSLSWKRNQNPNTFGDYGYSAHSPDGNSSIYRVYTIYETEYGEMADAEFVDDHPLCGTYVVEANGLWQVRFQVDTRDAPAGSLVGAGLVSYFGDEADARDVWDILECTAPDRETAMRYDLYLWGRQLVRTFRPKPKDNRVAELLRRLAVRMI
jgi:hypothetical protein